MVEKKTIGISALISLSIVLASLIIPGFFDTPKYYCEARPEVGLMECDGFSKYVSEVGKCLNPNGNKVCRDGWVLVTNDFVLDAEPISDPEPVINNAVPGTSANEYICRPPPEYDCIPK